MKRQILFSGKNKKNISVCCLLKILPRADTEHITRHMVPSFLYDCTKDDLSGTPLSCNPSLSTAKYLSKQYKPRTDATEYSVLSGSKLFATHPAFFTHINK